ncbi:sortase-associated OmpA-like protein PdsO [Aestuariibacter salexigens]|uniref:sortase-associated OmpA-like protein PdsO n=1 Tax=Aestuariibacter salexigens TaxID=226010 RepID=UPI000404C31D|nr:sortase-associated OmpA-like protein PdsO [Aestuariibacter salexigens]
MKKQLLTLTICAGLSCSAVAAEKESYSDLVGLSSGVVIGTLVAGPVGGAVAGLIGLLIAEDVENDKALADANLALADSQQHQQRLQSQLLALQQDIQEVERQSQLQLVSMETSIETLSPELVSQIQFRSGSAKLEPHFIEQLDLIADALTANPQLNAILSGYADRRGDDAKNKHLSKRRVNEVQQYLLAKGVAAKQLQTVAYGESAPVSKNQSWEGDFFDRRVSVRLQQGTGVMTAQQQ